MPALTPIWPPSVQPATSIIEPDEVTLGAIQIQPESGQVALAVGGSFYTLPQINEQPIVEGTFTTTHLPTSIDVTLTWDGTVQSPVNYSTSGHGATDTYLLAAQVATPVTRTGRYLWSLKAHFNGSPDPDQTISGNYANVVGSDITSPDQLVAVMAGGVLTGELRVYSSGSARFFSSLGGGAYTSPTDDFGTLSNTSGGFEYDATNKDKYLYNSSGLLTSIVDPHNNTTTYAYDANNLLTEVDYPNGTKVTMAYDINGHLTSISDPGNEVTTIAYSSGQVSSITNPDGGVVNFSYPDDTHMNVQWGPLNVTVTYDGTGGLNSGLPIGVDEGLGSSWTIKTGISEGLNSPAVNSSLQGVAVVTDPLNNPTTYTMDSLGRVLKEQTPDGATWQWQRNGSGLVTVAVDGRGYSTTMLYDTKGNVTEVLNPDGTNEQYTYNSFAEPTLFQDRLGHKTTYAYDANGSLLSVQDALGNFTTFTYYTSGLVSTMTDPVHTTTPTTFLYDSHDRLSVVIDPLNNRTTYVHDVAGNVTIMQDGNGNQTNYYYDGMNRLTGVTDPANGGAFRYTIAYNAIGEITSEKDELGRTTNFAFDQRGWRTSETDAAGTSVQRITTFLYDGAGNVTGVRDPNNNLVQYQYDAVDRPVAVLDAVYSVHATTLYDADGNVTGTIDRNGNRTTFLYDPMNRLTGVTDAKGNTSHNYYDGNGNVTQITDAVGNTTHFYYDLLNRLTMASDSLGTLEKLYYDKVGNVTQMTDANNNSTTYVFDADNRLTNSTDGLGVNHTAYFYDKVGNVTEVLDAKSHATSLVYDADNRVTITYNAVHDASYTYYDAVGNVTQVTDANNHTNTFTYDPLNRLTSASDGAGDHTFTYYDLVGNVTQSTDGAGNSTQYSYDANNRLTVVTALSNKTTMTLDHNGNVVEVTDPLGHNTQYVYDSLNRATVTIDALNARTTLIFDAAGNICEVEDGNGHTTLFGSDVRGRVTAETDPLSERTTYTYYGDTALVQNTTDANGRQTAYNYDADGRVTGVTMYSDGGSTRVGTIAYAYDGVGNLTYASNREQVTQASVTMTYSASYTMSYDALNRVSTVQEPFGLSLTFGYDKTVNRTQVQDSLGGTTNSVYDGADRLSTLENSGTGSAQLRVDLTYNGDGQISHETRYNSVAGGGSAIVGATTLLYDGLGQMTGLQQWNHKQNGLLDNLTYTYDPAGRMTITQENTSFTYHYAYDNDNQLTSDGYNTYTGGATITYDNVGNRTNTGYSTSSVNQYTSDGTWNYSYDADGNLVKKVNISSGETWKYSYDNFNHLQQAQDWNEDPSVYSTATLNSEVDMELDAFGNRIEEDVYAGGMGPPTTTRFAYDGWNPHKAGAVGTSGFDVWADLNGDSTLQTRYLHGDGVNQVFAEVKWNTVTSTATPYWLLTDRLGSVHEWTDNSTGSVVITDTYDAWGNLIGGTGELPGRAFGFAGMEWDPNVNLYEDRARYYDPTVGRFTSEDPWGVLGSDVNQYRYGMNDPMAFTDPSGDYGTWQGLRSGTFSRPIVATQLVGIGNNPLALILMAGAAYPPKPIRTVPYVNSYSSAWSWLGNIRGGWFNIGSNFSAGYADQLTGGVTSKVRQNFNLDGADYSSGWYTAGRGAGALNQAALTVVGAYQGARGFQAAWNAISTRGGGVALAGAGGATVSGAGGGGLGISISAEFAPALFTGITGAVASVWSAVMAAQVQNPGGGSSGASGGAPQPTPAQQAAANAAQGFDNFQCQECADSITNALKAAGQHGEVIEIGGGPGEDFIASGSYNNWQEAITTNGRHVGVVVDGVVFDNIHPNGLPLSDWLVDFDAPSGITITSKTPF
jgi:RHS repeat-associated protein